MDFLVVPTAGFRDASYGSAVTTRLAAMGIRDHPIAPRSPWQNGHAERLISSIRRECLDHIVVLGEAHLRRILAAYASYYNELRTHQSLGKDAPAHRPIQRLGRLAARPILGGLHHQYCRMSFLVGTATPYLDSAASCSRSLRFDDTRHTMFARSSAINSPPDRSTAKPTGLPRA